MKREAGAPYYAKGIWVQMLRFAVSGVLGFAVDTVVLYGVMALGLQFPIARVFSFLAAATFTWAFNRRHTFQLTGSKPPTWAEWLRYMAAMAAGGIINYLTSIWSYNDSGLVREYPVIAVALGSGVGMLFNFLSARYLVFIYPK
jgi:putative flippase GtrA